MKKNIFTDYNRNVRKLWKKAISAGAWPGVLGHPLWPIQYPTAPVGLLLFVGLNPSHNPKNDGILRLKSGDTLEAESTIQRVVELEKKALGWNGRKCYAYFNKFDQVLPDSGQNGPVAEPCKSWYHIDLFGIRCKSQDELKTAIAGEKGSAIMTDFAEQQIKQSMTLIDGFKPRVIVVVNAFASDLINRRLGNELRWNDSLGTYERKDVAWFFSGMLTGQRALDKYSFQRLAWHVRRALRQQKAE